MNAPTQTIAEQAAEWVLMLEEGDAEQQARTRQAFQTWQEADPQHAQAAEKVQAFIGRVTGLRASGAPARHALDCALNTEASKPSGKRKPWSATVLSLVLVVPLLFLLGLSPLMPRSADLQAGAGEWQSHTLADGSRIVLAGKSAVNVHFDEQRRALHLLSGEIWVEVARDAQRPFVVTTAFGQIEALGTRFIVNHRPRQTRLAMIESSVRVTPSQTVSSADAQVVQAGEQVNLSAQGLGAIEKIHAAMLEQSWHKQQLAVRGWPLAEVLRELARYHPAYIHVNEDTLPAIRVSAVLPLDKPDDALQLLASSFPAIRVRSITPWLVVVDGGQSQ